MNLLFKRTPLAAGILLALSSPVFSPKVIAAQGDPVLGEFKVNFTTLNSQQDSSIAMDADGDFVIAWQSKSNDTTWDVYAQRYSADGIEAGTEFLVNSKTSDNQDSPSIAMDADGDFVITWTSKGQVDPGYEVYAQRYTADGIKAGIEFQVNSHTDGEQRNSSIAMDADGDFVIAWQSTGQDDPEDLLLTFFGIYAQRYTADGIEVGAEFPVNSYTADDQTDPSIAMDADGDFVIAWQSYEQDGDLNGIYAQRYTADGNTTGIEFRVNTETPGRQSYPSIAMDADGDFVIAWQSYGRDTSDSYGVYA